MTAIDSEVQNAPRILPRDWRWVRLSKIAQIVNGFAFPTHLQGLPDLPYPFIKVSDMNAEGASTYLTDAQNTVDDELLARLGARTYPPGTIVFPKVGGALLTNKKRILGTQATFDNNVIGVIPLNTDTLWLFRWLQTVDLRTLANTTALPSIRKSDVGSLLVPLPPRAEQDRINSLLTRKIAAVEQARAAAEARLQLLSELVESYLSWSISTKGTRRVALGDILVEINKGVGNNWQDYRVIGATRAGLAPAKEGVGKTPTRYKLVDPGTVFYNPMRILLGSIAIVDEDEQPGITSPDYVVFRGKPGILHPRWFYYWLRSSHGEAFIKTLARGAVRERILFKRLACGEVNLPTWEAQVTVSAKFAAIRNAREQALAQLEAINKLSAALLRQAFAGEL